MKATKNKKSIPTAAASNKRNSFMIRDVAPVPLTSAMSRLSTPWKYPKEYEIMDSLKINQSALFPTEKKKIVDGIRTTMQKQTPKRFTVRKVDFQFSRIWRIEDNATARNGWGGHRVKGKGKAHARGPKLTHKDGTPIVPTESINAMHTSLKNNLST